MASTRNYLNYLNDQVDIAPANSQEELDAAHLVKELMDEHGLDTTLQEFDMPVAGDLAHSIVYLLLFVGIVLGGVLGSAAGAIGRVIVLVGIILLALRFGGYDILANLGPKARSQNVIGVHRASGPLVVKGNRPIVIVAHYDTPNEGLLWRRTLVRYLPALKRSAFWCVFMVATCCLFQVMGFLPAPARHVFWIIGIVASLPLLAIGVNDVYERFAPCTEGANDNKAAVAAMLGVLDKIRPGTDEAQRWAQAHPHAAIASPTVRDDTGGEEGQASSTEDGNAAPPEAGTETEGDATHVYSPGTIQIDADWVDGRKVSHEGAEGLPTMFGKVREGATGMLRRIREATTHEGIDDEAPDASKPDDATKGEGAPAILTPLEEIEPAVAETMDETAPAPEEAAAPEEMPGPEDEQAEPEVPEHEEPTESEEPTSSEAPMVSASEPIGTAEPEPPAEGGPTQVSAPSIPPIHKLDLTASQSVRRGAAFIERLNILPKDCEIVYDLPPVPDLDLSTLPEVPEIPDFSVKDFLEPEPEQEEPQPEEGVGVEEPAHHTGYAPSFLDNGYTRRAAEERAGEGRPYVPEVQEGYGDDGLSGEPHAHAQARRERTHELLESVPVPEYEALEDEGEHAPSIGQRIRAFFAGLDRRQPQDDEPLDDADIAVPELLEDDGAPDDATEREGAGSSEDAPSGGGSVSDTAAMDAPHEDLGTIGDLDTSGLHVQDDEPSGPAERTSRPEGVEDPNWGKAEYAPQVSSTARRAVLFDLPDPAQAPSDPLAASEGAEGEDLDSTEPTPRARERKLRNDTRPSHDADHPSHWKGGATTRSDLRVVERNAADESDQEREREAVLGMGDDELIAHDVWFVATGASELNHAGMREFLAEYRKQARGAFIVNLECIGAGDLTLLTSEGASVPRRADRRMVRLLSTIASDLHISLAKRRHDWAETDAYSALQSSMRAMTVMGMSEAGTPANAHSADDTAANVDAAQVVDVTELVAELIRRS